MRHSIGNVVGTIGGQMKPTAIQLLLRHESTTNQKEKRNIRAVIARRMARCDEARAVFNLIERG